MYNIAHTMLNGISAFARGFEKAITRTEDIDYTASTLTLCSIGQMLPFITKIIFTSQSSIGQKIAGYSFSVITIIAKGSPDPELRNRINISVDLLNALLCSSVAYNTLIQGTNDPVSLAIIGFNSGCALDILRRLNDCSKI